jgi:hypothetical protein
MIRTCSSFAVSRFELETRLSDRIHQGRQTHLVRDFAIMVRQRRLRPEKGRRKDLRKIESLIFDLRPLLDDE